MADGFWLMARAWLFIGNAITDAERINRSPWRNGWRSCKR